MARIILYYAPVQTLIYPLYIAKQFKYPCSCLWGCMCVSVMYCVKYVDDWCLFIYMHAQYVYKYVWRFVHKTISAFKPYCVPEQAE